MSVKNHRRHNSTKEASKPFFKNWLRLAGVIPIIIFAAFLSNEFFVQLPKAKQAQVQLEKEFILISPLPNASVVNHSASHKTSQALVETTYSTVIAPVDIFNHYDEKLKQHGWKPYGTSVLTDWGRDLGGKSTGYCKGNYSAQLQYAGEQANYGWTYAFSMSWGLEDCKTESKGGWVKQSIPVSLLFIAFGAFFVINGGNIAYNAWTKDSAEYAQWFRKWREQQIIRINSSKLFMSESYSLWNARIVSPVLLAMGLLFTWAGVYSLWRNIFGG